jgi:hypothetical protein
MARVISDAESDICVNYMKDGDVAVITKWSFGEHVGKVVQRYDNKLIIIGNDKDNCFDLIFHNTPEQNANCCVRILPKGTHIEL